MSKNGGLLEELVGLTGVQKNDSSPTRNHAIAWARVSTAMQKEQGLSIPEQLREIRVYAEKHGLEIVEEFSEAASAFQKEDRRIEFHRMLAKAKADPRVSVILVHDFSRFSRDSLRANVLVRELRKAGIKVVSLNDPEVDPETVAGVYMEAITFAKNEAYSREVAFHTRKGCRANIQARDPETGWCYKNGGQPLWGFRAKQLERGNGKKGRPIIKCIWVLDNTLVAGRPVNEWVRYCLVEMAAKGASLDELRDFCNSKGIPARRKRYWGTSTWHALLQPSALLQYCGYGVWNVHRKNGQKRPLSEWIIVENAHKPIITEDEAKSILAARKRRTVAKRFDRGYGRSRNSSYLLSGGLFVCGRCGSNMIGFRANDYRYYVCGSQPYRKGLGCGPGIYVPQEQLERDVLQGLRGLLSACTDPKGFTQQVNRELRRIWEERTGTDPQANRKIRAIDKKVANIRRAIEDGLNDAGWANARLRVLLAEREALEGKSVGSGKPPQMDEKTVLNYRRHTDKVLGNGKVTDRKKLLRLWVQGIKISPEKQQVNITYNLPEHFMNGVVAGVGFEPTTFGL